MALYNIDCGQQSLITIVNQNTGNGWAGVLPPGPYGGFGILLQPTSTTSIECSGLIELNDFGDTLVTFGVMPLNGIPYEQALLGLAGIVCAAFIAWAFLRGVQ